MSPLEDYKRRELAQMSRESLHTLRMRRRKDDNSPNTGEVDFYSRQAGASLQKTDSVYFV